MVGLGQGAVPGFWRQAVGGFEQDMRQDGVGDDRWRPRNHRRSIGSPPDAQGRRQDVEADRTGDLRKFRCMEQDRTRYGERRYRHPSIWPCCR